MANDWRGRLQHLRRRFLGATDATPSRRAPVREAAINLGVDFGTSFTKVAFQDAGTEEAGVVTFGGKTPDAAMIPSIIAVDQAGRLSVGKAGMPASGATFVHHLKMRLADDRMPARLPTVLGIDLNSRLAARALSSWFLATVLARAQRWVIAAEADRLKGRSVRWSANVGVPVEHYDSPAIAVFREVLNVGWSWLERNAIPSRLDAAMADYSATVEMIGNHETDCHAIPEIAAAVQSFLISREATEGIYVYFDIGGGTVDGVAFSYVNLGGQRRINFFSGKVAPLGIAALASRLSADGAAKFEVALAGTKLPRTLERQLSASHQDIQRLVAEVVITAKRKHGGDWQRNAIQDTSRPRRTLAKLVPGNMVPLIVFVGGGGAGSTWYQRAILSTYEDFRHMNAGIPPYELAEVPRPRDLNLRGLADPAFRRFAVAYGLSVPYGEGPEVKLPSQFDRPDPPQLKRLDGVIDYLDSKDAT